MDEETAETARVQPDPESFGIGRLFWYIRDAVIVGDAQTGRILLWNPAAEQMFGYTAAEAVKLTTDVLVPGQLRAKHQQGRQAYAANGHGPFIDSGQPVEVPAVRKGGQEIRVELMLSPLDRLGYEGRLVLAVVRDVSHRKWMEEVQAHLAREQAATAQAEAARRRMAFLADASALLASSLDYETTLANVAELAVPALADWCIIDLVEGVGRLRRVKVVHADPTQHEVIQALLHRYPPDTNPPHHPIQRALQTGTAVLTSVIPKNWAESVAQDDEHLHLLHVLAPRSGMALPFVVHGRVLGVMTLASSSPNRRYDADDLMLAEELALRAAMAIQHAQLYQQVHTALAVREEFLVTAAHELRTPLTALQAYLQLAVRRVARRANIQEIEELLDQAVQQVQRYTHLANGLLAAAEQAREPLEFERELVPISSLVERVVEAERAVDSGRSIELHLPETAPLIQGDAVRLEQVLANLLSNARKYSPSNSPILVKVLTTDGWVEIAVEDRGIGIPVADQERIFERFQRAGNIDRNTSGLGLGLAIARQIVQQHDGQLTVASEEGAGSRFIVRLPIHQARMEGVTR